jgi:hypothetical protein
LILQFDNKGNSMTDWDKKYMSKTLRNGTAEEIEAHETDWPWYLVGGAISVISMSWLAAWLIDRLMSV